MVCRVAAMTELPDLQNLLLSWWFDYDQGSFDLWPRYFTSDARFTCRSDSGRTAFEEFVTADVSGRDALLAWQEHHRRNSPYPLRHYATNVHLSGDDGRFRSYVFVTHVVAGAITNLSSGLCLGTVREEDGALRIAELHVVLDFTDSQVFDQAEIHQHG
jgi:hypothetical protein